MRGARWGERSEVACGLCGSAYAVRDIHDQVRRDSEQLRAEGLGKEDPTVGLDQLPHPLSECSVQLQQLLSVCYERLDEIGRGAAQALHEGVDDEGDVAVVALLSLHHLDAHGVKPGAAATARCGSAVTGGRGAGGGMPDGGMPHGDTDCLPLVHELGHRRAR